MNLPSLSSRVLLLILFISVINTLDINYYKSASGTNMRSCFVLPFAQSSSIITAIVSLYGYSDSFILNLYRPNTAFPSPPSYSQTLTGSVYYNSPALDISGEWVLQIVPVSVDSPRFRFNVVTQINNVTVGSFTDIARSSKIFTLYHNMAGTYKISMTVPEQYSSEVNLHFYGPFDSIHFTDGGQITGETGSNSQSILYHSDSKQYYYILIDASNSFMSSNQYISIKFKTDQYLCPYSSDFSDYNGVFQGCSSIVPTQGFPCINFDNAVMTCLACYPPWIANPQGVCIQDTSCPTGQYYSYGQCYDAIANCDQFDNFGGYCHTCKTGYNLKSYTNNTQYCQQSDPNCGPNQYLKGKVCQDYVQNCANFQSSTGICLICQQSYYINNNQCIKNQQDTISCPLGQTGVNGVCVVIDQYCIFYNTNSSCMLCAKGYHLNNTKCQKILCKLRQFSQYGTCIDVSPLCATYDSIYGNCLTCIPLYYLQSDGSCLQGLSSQMTKVTVNSGCPDNYYMRGGTCVQINPLCGKYDSSTGLCTTCLNTSYFLNSVGGCILISDYCGYRTYFASGNCLPVSQLCDQYDSTTGYCITCRDNTILTDGRCLYNQICGDRQYHSSNGSCIAVSDKCDRFDQSNGYCLSCINNYELNGKGICCYKFNYMLDKQCVTFFAQNCAAQRPTFNNCLNCKPGFTLANGVFGKCLPQ